MDNTEKIKFDLTEKTELTFTVQIEAPEMAKPEFRFVICESNEDAHMFSGRSSTAGEISVVIPPMKQRLAEGTYDARLEVIIDGKYFVPLKLAVEFAQPIRVQVESVRASEGKPMLIEETLKDEVQVTVSPTVVKKTEKVAGPPLKRGSLAELYHRKHKS